MRQLEGDADLVRTGCSAARPYGWHELQREQPWALDAYLRAEALSVVLEQMAALRQDGEHFEGAVPVLLRSIDSLWPFAPNTQLAPQPLAALDLLEYPDPTTRRIGQETLRSLDLSRPRVVARRSARAHAALGPLTGRLLRSARERGPPAVVEGDPRSDTRAAAAHMVGVLWVSASQAANVKELRSAVGMPRERLEAAYDYLLEHPPLGLQVQRHGDEFLLVSAPEVAAAVERHLGNPRPVALSSAALEVLVIIAYKQPIARSGIERIRGSNSDSVLETLVTRRLVVLNGAQLFVTTRSFLDFAGLRDLADLPGLENPEREVAWD